VREKVRFNTTNKTASVVMLACVAIQYNHDTAGMNTGMLNDDDKFNQFFQVTE